MKPSRVARPLLLIVSLLLPAQPRAADAAPDLLVADFEGDTYGDWIAEGEAFGSGPARGTLPGQMHVSGFKGKGLVNSFHSGDATTGTLTSPPFKLQRAHLSFLIGGGGFENATCMNLLHEGRTVRTATGPNTQSGGSEELEPQSWDVRDLSGKTVTLQIVDRHTGGWGHINVDHIVQTDQKPAVPPRPGVQSIALTLDKRYLLLPIRNGAKATRIDVEVDGQNVREFDAELARTREEASFWAFLDVAEFGGRRATIRARSATEDSMALIRLSEEMPGGADLYDEPLRPQFHFSQRLGWINDPNGMVHYDGEWHLYFQHNPYGWKWGNMHWGHAVSRDLVHWEQLPIALYNKKHGDWAFSGGAVVDKRNTAGWQTGDEKVIVASWTSTGRGECVAYSNDRGRTFTEYEGNPVIRHKGRDPKIIWYAPGNHWVLVVYTEREPEGRCLAFYTSANLKSWEFQSLLTGYYECPELVELAVDNRAGATRWVVFGADAQYAIGRFDGKTFTPEHVGKHRVHYGDYYASQIFNNSPDGRQIQVGWARLAMPDMPFNQTFTFPHELTLRTTEDGVRLFAEPVTEISKLHRKQHAVRYKELADGQKAGVSVAGGLFDIRAIIELGTATAVGLEIGGDRVHYDAAKQALQGAPLKPVDGRITLQILIDRPMIETIGNQGRVYITSPRKAPGDVASIQTYAQGGDARLINLEVHELKSIWK